MKILMIGAALFVAVAIAGLFLFSADIDREIEFAKPLLIDRPNQYLVCPKDFCADTPNELSPVFEATPEQVLGAWDKVVSAEPRITPVDQADSNRRSFIQRSGLLKFPDRVTMQVVPVEGGGTSLAVYSQSKYGYSDAGVNAARVKRLLAAVAEALK